VCNCMCVCEHTDVMFCFPSFTGSYFQSLIADLIQMTSPLPLFITPSLSVCLSVCLQAMLSVTGCHRVVSNIHRCYSCDRAANNKAVCHCLLLTPSTTVAFRFLFNWPVFLEIAGV